MSRVVTYICALLVAFNAAFAAQAPAAPAPAVKTMPSADIFSGTVTKLTAESVTVVRKVAGHDAVTRQFLRGATTKVEGKLRETARVTVRYKPGENGGFVAVYIIVR